MSIKMSAFEEAFKRRITHARSAREAQDAFESWFRQLSDQQMQAMIKGGTRKGLVEATRYLILTEKEESEDASSEIRKTKTETGVRSDTGCD